MIRRLRAFLLGISFVSTAFSGGIKFYADEVPVWNQNRTGLDPLYASGISFVDDPPSANPNSPRFPGSQPANLNDTIDYLAIVHHEFAHTRYGDVSVDRASTRTGISPTGRDMNELFAVDVYENPVRMMYGFAPRYRYWSGGLQGCSVYLDANTPC